MSRLEELLVLRSAIEDEIQRERAYQQRQSALTSRAAVALARGTWVTRTFTAVTTYFGVDGDLLLSGTKQRLVVDARHVAMWIMRSGGESYSHIGRELGVDHTTVMNGVRRVNRDEDLLAEATHLYSLLGQVAA